MFLNIKRNVLRTRRSLYVNVLMLLGLLSLPFITGCGGKSAENDKQRINDSIAGEMQKQAIIDARKKDSVANVTREQARLDSIAIADSIAQAKKNKPAAFKPQQVVTKYGVRVNDFKPKE